VQARISGEWRPAVANLGRRPTVAENADPTLEVHFPDWSGDLYGQELEVRFKRLLRPEMKFSGLEELKAQIQCDIKAALTPPAALGSLRDTHA
jgi:riboflavin kinase/FMN adenylyltransferase